MKRHPQVLDRNKSALLIIDIQEKILSAIPDAEMIIGNALKTN